MFVGHIAVALIAKRARPATSLGWYVAGATALDLIWPFALLVGAEHVRIAPGAMAFTPLVFESYPWSHSLLMAMVWGVLLAGLARWRKVDRVDATLVGVLVVSHWVLDFVTHGPDLPLWPGASPHVGLGLWNSMAGTFTVEGILWVVAIGLYLAPRRAKSWVGRVAFWSLIIAATAIWVSGALSPPPPDAHTLAFFALLGCVVFPWAAWADRNYVVRESHPATP
jgi:hypothetical protein